MTESQRADALFKYPGESDSDALARIEDIWSDTKFELHTRECLWLIVKARALLKERDLLLAIHTAAWGDDRVFAQAAYAKWEKANAD
jgi:hypothetical protein